MGRKEFEKILYKILDDIVKMSDDQAIELILSCRITLGVNKEIKK